MMKNIFVLALLFSSSLAGAAEAPVLSVNKTISFQGKRYSGKPIQQCLIVPGSDGGIYIRSVVYEDGVSFWSEEGKPGPQIKLATGTVSISAGVQPLGNVLGISMHPQHGEKGEPLGDGQYSIANADGRILVHLEGLEESALGVSPSGDYAFAMRSGHDGNSGPPVIYRQGDSFSPADWPQGVNSAPPMYSPDGKFIAVPSNSGQESWTIFLNRDGKVLWEIKESGIAAFSKSGLVAYVSSGKLRIYSTAGDKKSEIVVPGLSANPIVRFSADEKLVVIGDKGSGNVYLIDLAAKEVRWTLPVSTLETIKVLGKDVSAALQGLDATPTLDQIAVYVNSSGWEEKVLPGWGKVRDPAPLKGHLALVSIAGRIIDELAVGQEKLINDSNYETKIQIAPNGKQVFVGTRTGILDFKIGAAQK